MTEKKNIVFVGAFKKQNDGSTGGQAYACQSITESDLLHDFNWVKIDTTADSIVHVPFYKRVLKALQRILLFTFHISKRKNVAAIIFTAHAFSFYEKGLMVLIASFFRKKTILCPRSGFIVEDLKSKLKRKYFKLVFKHSSFVICQGNSWKTLFVPLLPKYEDKFIVLKNWVNLHDYSQEIMREKTQKEKIDILFLAWVDKLKGIFDLIDAVSILSNKEKVRVNVCGEGAHFLAAKTEVEKRGLSNIFIFHGWVGGKKKEEQLMNADIFVLPSYAEGLPNALLEAMIANCAVISSSVGSVPDVINHGVNGYMFNRGNVAELAKYLELLINNNTLRLSLGREAKNTILTEHNLEHALQTFNKILHQ